MNLDVLLRRGVLAVGIPVCLLGLFHLEENRRGFRIWVAWRIAQEAAGQCYVPAAYEPEAVSPSRNFAAAPVVAGSLSDRGRWEAFQAGPQPATGDWREGRAEDFSTASAASLADRLQPLDAALDELGAAARRPACNLRVGSQDRLIESPFVRVGPALGRTLRLRALVRLQYGDAPGALEDVLTGLRVAWHLRAEPTFLAQMVRRAWLEMMLQPVWEGLRARAWDGDQLARLQQVLEVQDLLASLRRAWAGERCAHAWAADALGAGRAGVDGAWRWLLVPRGWSYQVLVAQDRAEAEAMAALDPGAHRVRTEALEDLAARTQAPWRSAYRWADWERPWAVAAKLRYTTDLCATQAGLDLARTACALERCRLARGAYPAGLGELVPEFMTREPRNLYTGAAPGYQPGDGAYRLRCPGGAAAGPGGGLLWIGDAPQTSGLSTTAVPYATTSPVLCTSSPESKRSPSTPLAPRSRARAARRSMATRRVSSPRRA